MALGGNQAYVLGTFRWALQALEASLGQLLACSSAFRTRAVVPADWDAPLPPDYWNAVVALRTERPPQTLLPLLKDIERRAGRCASRRWASRPLDIDVLVYADLQLDAADLTVPHPRLAERAFVLQPLAEVAPQLAIPRGSGTVTPSALLDALPDRNAGIHEIRADWRVDGWEQADLCAQPLPS